MQLFLHPNFKDLDCNLKKVIELCHRQHQTENNCTPSECFETIKRKVIQKIRSAMINAASRHDQTPQAAAPAPLFREDYLQLFQARQTPPPTQQTQVELNADQELERWISEPATLIQKPNGENEAVHEFWRRQMESKTFHLLPNVARMVFAVPCSSAQIERDFGVSGMMVTSQRGSLSDGHIDMCSFLNRNRQYVDITQCVAETTDQSDCTVPTEAFDIMQEFQRDWDESEIINCFSTASMNEEDD